VWASAGGEAKEERRAKAQKPARLVGARAGFVAGRADKGPYWKRPRLAKTHSELHGRLHSWQEFDRWKRCRIEMVDVNVGFLTMRCLHASHDEDHVLAAVNHIRPEPAALRPARRDCTKAGRASWLRNHARLRLADVATLDH
jgi:hypothetical protein